MDYRVRNAEIFENTSRRCLTEETLRNAISDSLQKQKFYPEGGEEECIRLKNIRPAKLIISGKRSFEAAKPYALAGKKVCVLNFASAVSPGGGVIYGAAAQEESLCRCSTLYYCLEDAGLRQQFYEPHRKSNDPLYNDDIIYTPQVVVFKEDTLLPAALPEDEWYRVDVLTCAAPFLKKYDGQLTNQQLKEILEKRIRRILSVAAGQNAEVLILGAFGCGAFGNPPALVAEVFEKALQDYLYEFDTIEFAIYCSTRDQANLEAFRNGLQPLKAALTLMSREESAASAGNKNASGSDRTVSGGRAAATGSNAAVSGDSAAASGQKLPGLSETDAMEVYELAARTAASYKGSVEIRKADITTLDVECLVNAANEFLQQGGGVCGAIFAAAGAEQLQRVCNKYGHCDTGNAVITPGFQLKASYIIHAVGPVYQDGKSGEAGLLYSAYRTSLEKAESFGIHSIAFPLISAGTYGYPKQEAWTIALQACEDYLTNNCNYEMKIIFAVLSDELLQMGQDARDAQLAEKKEAAVRKAAELHALQKLQQLRREAVQKEIAAEEAKPEKAEPEEENPKQTEQEGSDFQKAEPEDIKPIESASEKPESEKPASEKPASEEPASPAAGLMDLIRTRRSCRAYRPDPVPKELIDSVIEAGLYAASGMNRQPVIIIAVTNKVLRDKISDLNAKFMGKENFDPFYGAPVILLVISQACPTASYDGSLALGNMMLRAHELGLGSCWIHRAWQEINDDFGKNLLQTLGLEGEYEGIGHLALGYAVDNEEKILPRREGRVFYIG